jgi:hypothetical protein
MDLPVAMELISNEVRTSEASQPVQDISRSVTFCFLPTEFQFFVGDFPVCPTTNKLAVELRRQEVANAAT